MSGGEGVPPGQEDLRDPPGQEDLRDRERRRQRRQRSIEDEPPPDLLDAWRQLYSAGRAGLGASGDAFKALRRLVAADIALARSAAGRALAFGSLAIVFGGSAWLLLMASLIVFLSLAVGIPWWLALVGTAVLSLCAAALVAWRAMHYFGFTRMQATRRQLARLGLGELARMTPPPGSPLSAREAAREQERRDAPPGAPPDDGRGADITPP